MSTNLIIHTIGAERTMTRFWKRAGIKEDKGKQKEMKQQQKNQFEY